MSDNPLIQIPDNVIDLDYQGDVKDDQLDEPYDSSYDSINELYGGNELNENEITDFFQYLDIYDNLSDSDDMSNDTIPSVDLDNPDVEDITNNLFDKELKEIITGNAENTNDNKFIVQLDDSSKVEKKDKDNLLKIEKKDNDSSKVEKKDNHSFIVNIEEDTNNLIKNENINSNEKQYSMADYITKLEKDDSKFE